MVNELSRGPVLAVELRGRDAVARAREAAGPRDVEVARRIRPHCLRAKFGVSAGAPAVHVTDLTEDGPLDCEYVFAMLDQS
jgi:nucleoside-diphosphate kinase